MQVNVPEQNTTDSLLIDTDFPLLLLIDTLIFLLDSENAKSNIVQNDHALSNRFARLAYFDITRLHTYARDLISDNFLTLPFLSCGADIFNKINSDPVFFLNSGASIFHDAMFTQCNDRAVRFCLQYSPTDTF